MSDAPEMTLADLNTKRAGLQQEIAALESRELALAPLVLDGQADADVKHREILNELTRLRRQMGLIDSLRPDAERRDQTARAEHNERQRVKRHGLAVAKRDELLGVSAELDGLFDQIAAKLVQRKKLGDELLSITLDTHPRGYLDADHTQQALGAAGLPLYRSMVPHRYAKQDAIMFQVQSQDRFGR